MSYVNQKTETVLGIINEVLVNGRVRHPHIMSCQSWSIPDLDQIRLVSERGQEILECLDSEQIDRWIGELIDGLAGLESAGIIHGDIKLDNIIIVEGSLKIIDFAVITTTGLRPAFFDEKIKTQPYRKPNTSDYLERAMYSLGQCIKLILRVSGSETSIWDDVIENLVNNRYKSFEELMLELKLSPSKAIVIKGGIPARTKYKLSKETTTELYRTAYHHDLDLNVVYLSLELIQRFYSPILNEFDLMRACLIISARSPLGYGFDIKITELIQEIGIMSGFQFDIEIPEWTPELSLKIYDFCHEPEEFPDCSCPSDKETYMEQSLDEIITPDRDYSDGLIIQFDNNVIKYQGSGPRDSIPEYEMELLMVEKPN